MLESQQDLCKNMETMLSYLINGFLFCYLCRLMRKPVFL